MLVGSWAPAIRDRSGSMSCDVGADVGAEHLGLVELPRLTGEDDLTLVEQEDEIGDLQGPAHILLDKQQRRPLVGQAAQEDEDIVDDAGGEAERSLGEEDE